VSQFAAYTLASHVGERYLFEDVWRVAVPRSIAWRMVDDVAR
jgi:hypothetical protein